MLRLLVLLVALAALAWPCAASADFRIWYAEMGMTGVSTKRGVTLRIAADRAYPLRSQGGKRATIACAEYFRVEGGFVKQYTLKRRVRLPDRGGTVRVPFRYPVDVCSVRQGTDRHAATGVSQLGRTYLREYAAFNALRAPFDAFGGDDGNPALETAIERGDGLVVALDGPDGTPPPDKVGYWVDGARSVVAVLTPAGRRLFIDTTLPDEVRTNAFRFLAAYLHDDVLP